MDRIETLKERLVGIFENAICGDISNIDAKELGELADMIKDMAEVGKLCEEKKYYEKVTEAMDEADPEEKRHYMDKYLPESRMYYTPIRYDDPRKDMDRMNPYYHDDEPMRKMDRYYDMMYYTPMTRGGDGYGNGNRDTMRNPREGRSGITRRTYMDMRDTGDKAAKTKELEHYMQDLASDITELIDDMDATEKAMVKQRLTQLIGKM